MQRIAIGKSMGGLWAGPGTPDGFRCDADGNGSVLKKLQEVEAKLRLAGMVENPGPWVTS